MVKTLFKTELILTILKIAIKALLPTGLGRPYTYSERVMFKCFVLKTVKRMEDCSALYTYLNHQVNEHLRVAVGLAGQLPCLNS